MAKIKYPLFVVVDKDNVAHDSANRLAEATDKAKQLGDDYVVKLYGDHKGDKSRLTK